MKAFKTVVCVRPVLDVRRTAPELDSDSRIKQRLLKLMINEADLVALEGALRIRESAGGQVLVLCNGNESTVEQLRSCLAMGADEVVLVQESEPHEQDGLMVAALLTKVIRQIEPDLILCGESSIEGMHGLVGPGIAHLLGVRMIMGVLKLEVFHTTRQFRAIQRLDRGGRLLWECHLPVLCTVASAMHMPRYTPVHRIAISRNKQIHRFVVDGHSQMAEQLRGRFGGIRYVGLSYPRIRTKKNFSPAKSMDPTERLRAVRSITTAKKEQNERLRGDPAHVAAKVLEFLVDKGFV